MKKNFILSMCFLASLCLVSCNDESSTQFKLKGTCWACEGTLSGAGYIERQYFYDVWYFTSETQAELTNYSTYSYKVDIGHGDDPMKYGVAESFGCGVIHVTKFNYPYISTYETSTDIYGNVSDKNYWDGEFVTKDLLIINKRRYLRVNR